MKEVTFVTALYDLQRDALDGGFGRTMDHYYSTFKKLLKQDINLVVYCDKPTADFVNKHRDPKNTKVIVKKINFPFKGLVDRIRTDKEWYSQAGWLEESPQAKLEWYNPLVMSKQFMLNDTSIHNYFGSKYFFWVDAGIFNTVNLEHYFSDPQIEYKLTEDVRSNRMLYLAFPYDGQNEVHGFKKEGMNRFSGVEDTEYVCRGGFFGGTREAINKVNDVYYKTLEDTLKNGYLGTEESVFTIISYRYSHYFNLQFINMNGLIGTYFDRVINREGRKDDELALYFLTYNAPQQLRLNLSLFNESFKKDYEKATKYLINNSTDTSFDEEYKKIIKEFGLKEKKFDNIGITGGRIFAAEHFEQSDHRYMIFFEDDMLLNGKSEENRWCECGFRKYDNDLFEKAVMIMEENELDYLKLSFSEVFGTNHDNWSWYNMPQDEKEKFLVNEDCPENKTKVHFTGSYKGLPYAIGEYHYCNWPILFSREGNKKLFIDALNGTPPESIVMATSQKLIRQKKLKAATLLASTINHHRSTDYSMNRVENRYNK